MAMIPAALAGVFAGGYTPDDVNAVLGPLSWQNAERIVCLWGLVDEAGPGGDSEFYVLAGTGRLSPVDPEVCRFLLDEPGAAPADLLLPSIADRSAPALEPAALVELDAHNLALSDLR